MDGWVGDGQAWAIFLLSGGSFYNFIQQYVNCRNIGGQKSTFKSLVNEIVKNPTAIRSRPYCPCLVMDGWGAGEGRRIIRDNFPRSSI